MLDGMLFRKGEAQPAMHQLYSHKWLLHKNWLVVGQ